MQGRTPSAGPQRLSYVLPRKVNQLVKLTGLASGALHAKVMLIFDGLEMAIGAPHFLQETAPTKLLRLFCRFPWIEYKYAC